MFTCKLCDFKCKTLNVYNKHQYLHRNWIKPIFYCMYENCYLQFTKYERFRLHVYRLHSKTNEFKETTSFNNFQCKVKSCNFNVEFTEKKAFFKHLNYHFQQNEKIICPYYEICNCNNNFQKMSTLKAHITRKHFDNLKVSQLVANDNSLHSVHNLVENCEIIQDQDERSTDINQLYLKVLSSTYLTLTSKYFLSERSLNKIIEAFSDLEKLNNSFLIQKIISELNIENNEINNQLLQNIFKQSLFNNAHNKDSGLLRNSYLRNIYYKKFFNFVEPVKILLNQQDFFIMYQ